MNNWERYWDVIFPSNIYCICCGSVIDQTRPYALCDACIEKFHWVGKNTCEKCGKILDTGYLHAQCIDCRATDHLFVKGFTCTRYGLYERVVMMDYKYHDQAWIGRKLGDVLADRMTLESLQPDLVIPVPIHPTRAAERGYNQVDLMCRQFAKKMKWKVHHQAMIRHKDTLPMRNLGIAQRNANVLEAFSLTKEGRTAITNKTILLVDDIFTTGSTADSCTKTLLQGGAKAVYLLTFACGSNVIPYIRLQ